MAGCCVLAHGITGSGESTTHQFCRPWLSTTEVVRPHTLWLKVEEEGEQSIYTQYKHQRWPEPCIGDGKTELTLLSCSDKLYIQLYPSNPSTAHMLQQAGLTSAPVPACGYSAAGEPFDACLCSGYSITAEGLFDAVFLCCVFIQESSRLSNDLSLILLLSLVPLHADHLLQLRESKTSERLLGEDVRELSTSFDELDGDLPSINTVPEEVELYVDVFTPVVQNRILCEDDGGLVVHH